MADGLGAVILAGGRAARLGGTDKPGIVIGEQSLVAWVARAAKGAGARRLVVVGPARPELPGLLAEGPAVTGDLEPAVTVEFTCERPPQAGPATALAAGLQLVTEPWVLLLAADLPFLRAGHLRTVADAAARARRGAVLADDEGRPQWLTSCWPAAELRTALTGYAGHSLGGVLGPLSPVLVTLEDGSPGPGEPPPWLDCDTPEELAAARRLAWLQEGTR